MDRCILLEGWVYFLQKNKGKSYLRNFLKSCLSLLFYWFIKVLKLCLRSSIILFFSLVLFHVFNIVENKPEVRKSNCLLSKSESVKIYWLSVKFDWLLQCNSTDWTVKNIVFIDSISENLTDSDLDSNDSDQWRSYRGCCRWQSPGPPNSSEFNVDSF